jgi:hypothetical protein
VKIAYDIIIDETSGGDYSGYSDEDLTRRLNEFISAGIRGNDYFDGKVSEVLSELLERRVTINNTISDKLSDYLKDTRSERLIDTGYYYQMRKITVLDVPDGARYIAKNLKPDTKLYDKLLDLLINDREGGEILDAYYANYTLPEDNVTQDDLTALRAKTRGLPVTREVDNRLGHEVAKLYYDKLKAPCDEVAVSRELRETLERLLPGRTALIEKFEGDVYEHYWDAFDISKIDFDNKAGLNAVVRKGNRNCDAASRVFKIGSLLKLDDLGEFKKEFAEYEKQNPDGLSEWELDAATAALVRRCIELAPKHGERDLFFWLKLAVLSGEGKNPVPFLLKNKIQAFTTSFLSEVHGEDFTPSTTEKLLDCMGDYAADKSNEGYDVVSRLIGEYREREKRSQAEEKQRAKEEKRAKRDESAQSQDGDASGDKTIGGVVGDSISKLKGIFGKSKK